MLNKFNSFINGDLKDSFSYFGIHEIEKGLIVRTFFPEAKKINVIQKADKKSLGIMKEINKSSVFELNLSSDKKNPYILKITDKDNNTFELEDAYRFQSTFGELDRYLISEGTHFNSYEKMGAHPSVQEGVKGTSFAVWAPNAKRVSVVGDFNGWDGRRHIMRFHPSCGVWEMFIPHVQAGDIYKYEIKTQDGKLMPLKTDPYSFYSEIRPKTGSVVHGIQEYKWNDDNWMKNRNADRNTPVSIYEVHTGSWKRKDGNEYLSYRELADDLIPYVKWMGYTHIELLPISEHPFDGSWGYQTIGLYAPTSRFGTPEDFKYFVDKSHQEGLGIILDWVAGHFPKDEHGLECFDGVKIYEHEDPRKGEHKGWGTLIYNYSRNEVRNFLLSNALFWLDKFHIDGLRVDAVASMLYLDYDREHGEWIPNEHGGRENLETVAFLKRLNELVYEKYPGAITIAEESTSWPMVSHPTYEGGLGFTYKWNMGWMHDTLKYISQDPIYRTYNHNDLTFGMLYAFTENFVLPISHDEVVHGKGSLIARMPGDEWQRFANLRLYLTLMMTYPGKKTLFMGCEFGQYSEWNYETSLDWHLNQYPFHNGVQLLTKDLNNLYKNEKSLHIFDCEQHGFKWIECNDTENSVLSYIRSSDDDYTVIVANFTPAIHKEFRVGVPDFCHYKEIFNSDSTYYSGSNKGNGDEIHSDKVSMNGFDYSLKIMLPPLGALVFKKS